MGARSCPGVARLNEPERLKIEDARARQSVGGMSSDLPPDFGSRDFPWPSASDTLHGPSSDRVSAVSLGWAKSHEPIRAIGFREAAALLAEAVAARGQHEPELDVLAYPFLFCWRHYLELELKQLIRSARGLLGEQPDPKEKPHHRLGGLWTTCRQLLERIDSRNSVDYDNAGRLIFELDALDPDGQHLRYAWTRATKKDPPTPTLPSVDKLSIDRIHAALTGLAVFLEAAEAQIDDLTQASPR